MLASRCFRQGGTGRRFAPNLAPRYEWTQVIRRYLHKRPFETVLEIAKAAKLIENELDGTGRLLLRYSGTENLARVMIEGKDQASIEQQANHLAEIIRLNLA